MLNIDVNGVIISLLNYQDMKSISYTCRYFHRLCQGKADKAIIKARSVFNILSNRKYGIILNPYKDDTNVKAYINVANYLNFQFDDFDILSPVVQIDIYFHGIKENGILLYDERVDRPYASRFHLDKNTIMGFLTICYYNQLILEL